MNRKLFISLAPLLATVAFVTPSAAQAFPNREYEVGRNTYPREERVPYIAWGTLTFTITSGGTPIQCEDAVGGWVEKATTLEETNGWTAYNCKDEECETAGGKIGLIFENENGPQSNPVRLEWPGELIGGPLPTFIRLKITNVRLYPHCQFAGLPSTEAPAGPPFTGLEERDSKEYNAPAFVVCRTGGGGTLTPRTFNQAFPLFSKIIFTGGAGGELECGSAGKMVITGSLKTMAYEDYEEIWTK